MHSDRQNVYIFCFIVAITILWILRISQVRNPPYYVDMQKIYQTLYEIYTISVSERTIHSRRVLKQNGLTNDMCKRHTKRKQKRLFLFGVHNSFVWTGLGRRTSPEYHITNTTDQLTGVNIIIPVTNHLSDLAFTAIYKDTIKRTIQKYTGQL